jgi:O-acetylhomoserine (thiol)-lyase
MLVDDFVIYELVCGTARPRHQAEFLEQHPAVESVRYPGLPSDTQYENNLKYLKGKGRSLVVFEIKGGADMGQKYIARLKLR